MNDKLNESKFWAKKRAAQRIKTRQVWNCKDRHTLCYFRWNNTVISIHLYLNQNNTCVCILGLCGAHLRRCLSLHWSMDLGAAPCACARCGVKIYLYWNELDSEVRLGKREHTSKIGLHWYLVVRFRDLSFFLSWEIHGLTLHFNASPRRYTKRGFQTA